MKKAEVKIQFVTPCIMSGADQRKAEFRAPSIRGNLRWWMRALGSSNEEVNAIFGSANGTNGMRSRIIVRDTTTGIVPSLLQNAEGLTGNKNPDYFLWPLRPTKTSDCKRGVIPENATVSFSITVRHANDEQDNAFFKRAMANFERALKAFLLFGSLGTRSRRCYGSIWPTEVIIDGVKWSIPKTPEKLKAIAKELQLEDKKIFVHIVTPVGSDDYHPRQFNSWKAAVAECRDYLSYYRKGKGGDALDWGRNDHDAPFGGCQQVYRAALGLPLAQRYTSGTNVETSIDGYERLASPLHLKVVMLDGGFVPLAIFFRAMLPKEGTRVRLKIKGGRERDVTLSHELVGEMMNCGDIIPIEKF